MISRIGADDQQDHKLSVLDAKVTAHDNHYGLTEIQVGQHTIQSALLSTPAGSDVRVVIPASEISLSVAPLQTSSIQNCIPTQIASIQEQGNHHVLLSLALDEQTLISQITRKSFDKFQLSAGKTVYACFKTSGLEVI